MAYAELAFLGPAYQARSATLSDERCVNWYFEAVESGKGKAPWALYPTPGLKHTLTLPGQGGIRGMHRGFPGRRPFVAQGDKLYELTSLTSFVERGTIVGKDTSVSMDTTEVELCVVASKQGWILDLKTNDFSQITDPSFFPTDTVVSTGGYLLFNHSGTNQIFFSGLLNGKAYNSLDFFSAEQSPDGVIGLYRTHGEVWALGDITVQPFRNTGAVNNPFTSLPTTSMEIGVSNPFAMVQLGEWTYWVGENEDGVGTVWRTQAYSPIRISTHAIEFALNATDFTSISAYGYQEEGHFFYVLQTLTHTWVYDATTGLWHERGRLLPDGLIAPQTGWKHMMAFGKHLVGDATTGDIYITDLDTYTLADAPLPRIRRAPYWATQRGSSLHHMIEIDMQVGEGTSTGPQEAVDPMMSVTWSDTHGKTWGNRHTLSLGKQGEFPVRLRHWQLGQTYDRIYEVRTTAQVKMAMLGAFLNVTVLTPGRG